jgi:oligoendopeptidase F
MFLSGNPEPTGDYDYLINSATKMYHEMSKESGEFFEFMKEHHLLDLVARPGKQPGGYMTFLDDDVVFNKALFLEKITNSSDKRFYD